ncbi:hypothetical protein TKK_0002995 [Trichogramma kaykai]|uniref:Reverse transcriptase domain-containing protein n=1 Tax=Trichogramma kaykai TaxID=54128 RepID=A0ABD2XRD8_9HYME
MIPVTLSSPSGSISVLAFLDGGSAVSIVSSSVSRKVGCVGIPIKAHVQGFKSSPLAYEKVSISLNVRNESFLLSNALSVDEIGLPFQSVDRELANFINRVLNINVAVYEGVPGILIGQDYWEIIESLETRRLDGTGLAESRSKLGWSVHGRRLDRISNSFSFFCVGNACENECDWSRVEQLVENYFELDSLGVKHVEKADICSRYEMKILEGTIRRLCVGWEIGLLWRSDIPHIPNSRATALNRLSLLERKLDRDDSYAELFYKEMDRLFEHGFAAPAPERLPDQILWYLPCFGVRNPNKPGKVRLVFDVAAKSSGVCFNDLLNKGPDLINSLIGVLMRFRRYAIAFKGDMRDMFLKVKVREHDWNAQRFLWRGRDRGSEPKEFVMTSLLFGGKSSPCEAIFVKNKNARELSTKYPEAAESIVRNSYVDDYLDSVTP